MREKVILVGAGSAMFTRGMVADLIRQGWEYDLALVLDGAVSSVEIARQLADDLLAAQADYLGGF